MSRYRSTTFKQRAAAARILRRNTEAPGAYEYLALEAYAKKKAASTASKVTKAMQWNPTKNPQYLKRMAWRWHAFPCRECGKGRSVSGELRCIVKRIGSSKSFIHHVPLVGMTDWIRELQGRYKRASIECECVREP